ncbi:MULTISPECIES: ATP synthase F0 subunit C [Nesterenkonia]|uniref:ATP synthase subunit c n=5 Tax=Nesterenkonia TaxID=57494 RepID=A0A0W8ICP2_9MICC|nr:MULTISPECIES: ATP synthase F0 subunit C [Nesterenkonia]EXF24508.1 ATP synthase subunit C [Nesterenkonia sp. AN1]KUG57715.1 ATP synthase subunit C [Nesterenkonia jeotgali]MBA8920481.1 F-type H+-transporting ATPase subunit c [Nesterenkonia jeotgali]MBE1523637.1 F-type H+-transporting ATPase subunit c [Nesterenkonia lutea]MBO0596192.1 ATP synthase F0 subunit C [Nesterenkonia sp. E16_10]
MDGTLNMVGMGLAGFGAALAIGMIFSAYLNGVARQPEAQRVLQPIAILGFALAEAVFILAIVFAFVL